MVMIMNPKQISILKDISELHPHAYGTLVGQKTGLSMEELYSELCVMHDQRLVGYKLVERGGKDEILWSVSMVGRDTLAFTAVQK
jgi:hypothetical protein